MAGRGPHPDQAQGPSCRPGHASRLAALFKETAALAPGLARDRVLTDLTGDFNRVFREKLKGYTDLYIAGSREMLRVV